MGHSVCSALPIGTHFLWHRLNGTAFYVASRGLLYELSRTAMLHSPRDRLAQE